MSRRRNWFQESKNCYDMKRAVFFCSASYTIDPKFNDIAREFVAATCREGYDIVSGGAIKGTMNAVADEASKFPGENIGCIPRFMKELVHPALTKVVWTDTMSERKEAMRVGVSLAVALPGGIGTLDELAETYTLMKLGILNAKLVVVNIDGVYDPLRDLLDKFVEMNTLDSATRSMINFVSSIEEYKELIRG